MKQIWRFAELMPLKFASIEQEKLAEREESIASRNMMIRNGILRVANICTITCQLKSRPEGTTRKPSAQRELRLQDGEKLPRSDDTCSVMYFKGRARGACRR
jgi:hypothetical protein